MSSWQKYIAALLVFLGAAIITSIVGLYTEWRNKKDETRTDKLGADTPNGL